MVPVDIDGPTRVTLERVRPYTMTSVERLTTLRDSVQHVVREGLPGAFVECGVWRGGSSMTIALTLLEAGITDRDLYLFDTFEGMSAPTEEDVNPGGIPAAALFEQHATADGTNDWCRAGIDDVRANMTSTGYPMDRVHFVIGKVEDTLPDADTGPIALLRLDTDWYESTAAEMDLLYPHLVPGGVLIIDDYGHWQGSRKAVDDYFDQNGGRPLLVRVDDSGRMAAKPG